MSVFLNISKGSTALFAYKRRTVFVHFSLNRPSATRVMFFLTYPTYQSRGDSFTRHASSNLYVWQSIRPKTKGKDLSANCNLKLGRASVYLGKNHLSDKTPNDRSASIDKAYGALRRRLWDRTKIARCVFCGSGVLTNPPWLFRIAYRNENKNAPHESRWECYSVLKDWMLRTASPRFPTDKPILPLGACFCTTEPVKFKRTESSIPHPALFTPPNPKSSLPPPVPARLLDPTLC